MDALATPQDVEDAGFPVEGQSTRVVLLIGRASALVRAAFPTVDERVAAGSLDGGLVASVVADMVRRVLVNPEGFRQTSETVGPFSRSGTYADEFQGLALTDADRLILAGPVAVGRRRGVGTIRLRVCR